MFEEIIKKSIEGGYKPNWSVNEDKKTAEEIIKTLGGAEEIYSDYFGIIKQSPKPFLDPLFWQSLGKACGWEKLRHETTWNAEHLVAPWLNYALRFHEINLTESFSKAVEYLSGIIK